jgi:hypothetical protein
MKKIASRNLLLFLLIAIGMPLFSFAQPPQPTKGYDETGMPMAKPTHEIIIDWNEVGEVGICSAHGLVIAKNDPVPFDFSPPIFSNFGIEVGVRYPIFFDRQSDVSFAAEAPLQLGVVNSTGPSASVPKYSTSIWVSVPAMLTMNHGLGASYENTDKKFGAYIGIGVAYNKALIREKYYTFYYTTQLQQSIAFRYVGYLTANGMTGIRWRNRHGIVRNLGLEGNYGVYGEWMLGISFGMVIDM